jgi:hypothetical protein
VRRAQRRAGHQHIARSEVGHLARTRAETSSLLNRAELETSKCLIDRGDR